MKLALALGVAIAGISVAAYAANPDRTIHVRHIGAAMINFDANDDGWLTREEAAAAADAAFARLDTNNDGRLTDADETRIERRIEMRLDGGLDGEVEVFENGARTTRRLTDEERTRIERSLEQAEAARERAEDMAEHAVEHAERMAEQAQRHGERAAREAERQARVIERHIARAGHQHERHVVIIRGGGDESEVIDGDFTVPAPPMPPMPAIAPLAPSAPAFMMLALNDSEADSDGDGALSREEFRAQQLRFFDASDANSDGRVRFETPEPPEAPEAPEPPAAPQR